MKEPRAELHSVMLRPCTASVLVHVLPPGPSFVWIRHFSPMPYLSWWKAPVALSPGDEVRKQEVRALEFDLLLPGQEFLTQLRVFEKHGLDLYVTTERVPDTLTLEGLPSSALAGIMGRLGIVAHFDLPAVNHEACLSTPSRDVMDRWLAGPLREWVRDRP